MNSILARRYERVVGLVGVAAFASLTATLLGTTAVEAQMSRSVQRYVPPIVRTDGGGAIRATDATPARSAAERDRLLVPQVRGVVIVDQVSSVKKSGLKAEGVVVRTAPDAVPPEVVEAAERHVGRAATLGSLDDLSREMVVAFRRSDRPVVNVVIPEQEITGGVIQVLVVVGRLGRVSVEGASTDPAAIVSEVGLVAGEPISEGQLLDDLRYLNRNPFRRVDALYQPGKSFGQTDVVLQVADDKPWAVYAGAESKGGRGPLGPTRIFEGAMAHDLFGFGETIGYQLTHAPDIQKLQSHMVSLALPLAYRWDLQLVGGYSSARIPLPGGPAKQNGENYIAGAYLGHALPHFGTWSHGIRFGAEFKSTNNDLDFSGTTVATQTPDIVQAVFGYSGETTSWLGKTRFEANVYGSPGGVTPNNSNAAFDALRKGAKAGYTYVRAGLNQRVDLPYDFRLLATIEGQWANTNLLPTETFSLGGMGSVRGFAYGIARADSGVTANFTFYTPGTAVFGGTLTDEVQDQLRAYAFLDHGAGWVHTPLPGEKRRVDLTAAGVGLTYEVAKFANVDFGYGWHLGKTGITDNSNGSFFGRVVVRY
ncbi:MAG: BamA/TamA family outer membrane protein [Siculibacillus sp.]|nr:BamA/TamA family outer membrane protein [Siculibacillus sp.]